MSLPVAEFTLGDLKDAVAETYFLDNDINHQIVIRHSILVAADEKKRSVKYIADDNVKIPSADRLQLGATL